MANTTEQKTVEIIIKGKQANATMREMESAVRVLNAELKKLPVNSKEFADKSKELQALNKRLKSIQDDVKGVGGVFQSISKEIKAFGLIALSALGFQFLSQQVTNLINQNAKLSDSFADIRKTTGMTAAEVEKLNKAFGQMNTRTSTKELRDIAIAAGQLGIVKEDIFAFTAATDKLVVSLGDEFSGGAEQVTKEMGLLRNVFADIKTNNIAEDMLHIGNAINALAAKGQATGPVVSDFANRIGGVGIPLGLTSAQVLGLSATLQELNVNTERGGTAITRILLKMTQNVSAFSDVAEMDVQKFSNLVNTDLYGAFLAVVEGSQKSGKSATQLGSILDGLGVDGAGASEVFAKLGKNTDMLADKVSLAGQSLKTTDTIMQEFNLKNENFAANIDKIGKWLSKAFVNSAVMSGMQSMASWLAKFTEHTHAASDALREEQVELETAFIKITSLNVGNKQRVELIQKLQEKYPDYLKNIDAEKVSNEQLKTAIDGVITSLVNRIVIQTKEEDIQEQLKNAAEAKNKVLENEKFLLDAINEAYRANAEVRKKGNAANVEDLKTATLNMSLQEKANYILKSKNSGLADEYKVRNDLFLANNLLSKSEKDYNVEVGKGILLQKEAQELKTRLGITDAPTSTAPATTKPTTTAPFIDDKEAEKLKKKHEDLLSEIDKLNEEFNQRNMDERDKEVASIADKYAKLLVQTQKGSKEEAAIIALWKAEEEATIKAYNKKIIDANKTVYDKDMEEFAKFIEDKQALSDKINLMVLDGKNKEIEETKQKYKALYAEALKYNLDVTALKEKEAKDIAAIDEKWSKKDAGKSAEKMERFVSEASGFLNSYSQLQRSISSRQLSEIEQSYNKQIKDNEELYKNKQISEEQYEKNKAKIRDESDKKEAEIKIAAWEREKKLAKSQAVIDGALTVLRTLAKYGYTPLGIGLSAAAVFSTGLQISAIENSPKPYAKGGYNRTSNDPQGFTQGATLYTNSASGAPFIAGEEGEEWIAPNWMIEHPKTAPVIQHLEAIRKNRAFEKGGFNSTTAKASGTDAINLSNDDLKSYLIAINATLNRLNSVLDEGIEAKMSYDVYVKEQNRINAAIEYAKVS